MKRHLKVKYLESMIEGPRVRYAQCWEDPRSLTEALAITQEDDVLSIASGGDNSFALLLENPHSLTAIDCNPAQIFLLELKIRAIQTFEYGDFVSFIGARASQRRRELYSYVRPSLSAQARWFWDAHPEDVLKGIIHSGKFETYFSIFRQFILPCIHGKKTVEQLLSASTLEEQRNFYEQVWNNRRWRCLFRIFFGEFVLGRLGRDPSFFRYVSLPSVAEELLCRSRRGLAEVPVQDNFFLEYILTGEYRKLETAHPYLRESNFCSLREGVESIRLVVGSLAEYLRSLPSGSISKFNLSDVFEYMSDGTFQETLRDLDRVCRDGARVAFWTLFVPRTVPIELGGRINSCSTLSRELIDVDRTFFYGDFCVWRVEGERRTNPTLSQDVSMIVAR